VRYPYPRGVGVPRLGRPCRSRSLSLVIRIPLSTQSKCMKVVLAENFSEENFDAEGASPFLDPRRPLGPGPLRRAWMWSLGLPEPWPHSSVSGPKVCFARFVTLFMSPFFSLRLKNVVLLSAGFETALNKSVKNCKALAQAAEQKEADRVRGPCPRPSRLSARPLASTSSPCVAPPRVICGPWAAMCAADSRGAAPRR
jgi:hypothetical protein